MSLSEDHHSHRVGWLRAAVLGANDGIVSTSSLVVGVAAASADRPDILLAGMAGLVAGAMSMAAGEYVSVKSQSDAEAADLAKERQSLHENYELEKQELADIYVARGLQSDLALQVADQLMAHDALGAHARDEIGITEIHQARPIQAAWSSALTFTIGSALPLAVAWLAPIEHVIIGVSIFSLIFLCTLGLLSARAGGAPMLKPAIRVTLWGALAMLLTGLVGRGFGIIA